MRHATRTHATRIALSAALLAGSVGANADVMTDWNTKAGELVVEAKLGTPPANRVMAIVQTAVYEAVNAITGAIRPAAAAGGSAGASVDAAVAAANRVTLTKLMPSQQTAIEAAYQAALATVADGPAKTRGHRRRRAGRGGGAGVTRRRRRWRTGGVPPAHHRGRLRADRDAGRPAVAAAQAVADDERGAVPPGPAAGADERGMGARLRRSQGARRQDEHPAHGGADRDRALLGVLAAADLSRRRALGGRHAGARVRRRTPACSRR